MFVVTDQGVIVTDPLNPRAASQMMEDIRKITDQPIRYAIYSHEHWDHILGGQVFKDAGATFVAQENCVDFFERRPNDDLVMPDEIYSDKRTITLGGKTVELYNFGRNHGNCMTVMRLPEEKLLFTVDIVSDKRIAFRIMSDYHPGDWVRSLREIEKLDFERIVPGHGAALIPAESVRLNREYVEDLMVAVESAMHEIHDSQKLKETVKLEKYADWVGYETWFPLNVERIWAYYALGW